MSGYTNEYREERVSFEESASGPYPCLTWGPLKASFWVTTEWADEAEKGEKDYLVLELKSKFPYPYEEQDDTSGFFQHEVISAIEEEGLADLLGIDGYYLFGDTPPHRAVLPIETFLLKNGIAPCQPFRLEFELVYSAPDMDGECDRDVYWELVEIQHLDIERATDRWQEYLGLCIVYRGEESKTPVTFASGYEMIVSPSEWGELKEQYWLFYQSTLPPGRRVGIASVVANLMEEKLPELPPPGSPEAKEIGCTCSETDNRFGRGVILKDGVWAVHRHCQLHNWMIRDQKKDMEISWMVAGNGEECLF